MPYVMFPVPEHHEDQFNTWLVTQTVRAKITRWPAGAVEEALGLAGDLGRRVLFAIAHFGNLHLVADEVAERLDLSVPTLVRFLDLLNTKCAEHGWPPMVVVGNERLHDSDDGSEQVILTMVNRVRARVLDYEASLET